MKKKLYFRNVKFFKDCTLSLYKILFYQNRSRSNEEEASQDKTALEGTFLERGIFHRKYHASFTASAVIIFAQTNSENMEIRIRPCRATVNNCILAPAHATLGNGAKSAYRAFFPLTNPLFDSIAELINIPFDKMC